MVHNNRIVWMAVPAWLAIVLPLSPGFAQPSEVDANSPMDITVSFKFDAGPTYGGARWVSPPTYISGLQMGSDAAVEIKVAGVDGRGKPVRIRPEWTVENPDMVVVSPISPELNTQFRITVKRGGASSLKVAAQGISKELLVGTKPVGQGFQIEITPRGTEQKAGRISDGAPPNAFALKSRTGQFSYAIGMNIAASLQKESVKVDAGLLVQGFQDAYSGGGTLMTEEDAQAILLAVRNEQRGKQLAFQAEKKKELAARNTGEGEAFLSENRKKEGVVSLPSGLQYKVLKAGGGNKPGLDDTVVCQYRGTLLDGTEFDSSYRRKRPAAFPLQGVIQGWREALQLMPVGSRWQLFVPPALAYGERGSARAHIGPNATLIFEIELISIQNQADAGIQRSEAMN